MMSLPSGQPAFKWGKERGSPRGAVENTRHFAGVRRHVCPHGPGGASQGDEGGSLTL